MEALAVKYRPQTWSEMTEQTSIVKILQQQLDMEAVRNAYLFCGASGSGKAQPLTSNVLTKNGYVRMGDLKVGDYVINRHGKETKVLGVYPQGIKDVYRIHFNDGASIDVAKEHLNVIQSWDIKRKAYIEEVLETSELLKAVEKSKTLFIPAVPVDCWEDTDLVMDPYLVGALIGDGSLHRNVGFSNIDEFIINKVNNKLLQDYNFALFKTPGTTCDYTIKPKSRVTSRYIIEYKHNTYNSIRSIQEALQKEGYPRFDSKSIIRIASNSAKQLLKKYPELQNTMKVQIQDNYYYAANPNPFRKHIKELNLNKKAVDKRIPKNYIHASFQSRLALLQGLMDTDGYVSDRGRPALSLSNKGLIEDVIYLCNSLGIVTSFRHLDNVSYVYKYKDIKERRKAQDVYTLYMKVPNSLQVTTTPNKVKGTARFEPRRIIKNIDYIGKQECQCIYVESEDHTYLTDHMIITHNTTTGRLFAKAINKNIGTPIEIDAASNSGVDNVRQIIKAAQERALDSKYKIYIIDEAHALSNAAWQAFLKCLEEPPAYTIFIFCTTDAQKIPATILNRVQRFNFTRISQQGICERLRYICAKENYTNFSDAIDYISRIADGGMRDAIAYLEKAASYSIDLNINNVLEALGNYSYSTFFDLLNAMIDGDEQNMLSILCKYYEQGNDLKLFIDQFTAFTFDVAKYNMFKTCSIIKIPAAFEADLKNCINIDGAANYYSYLVDKLLAIKQAIKEDTSIYTTLQIMLLQATRCL